MARLDTAPLDTGTLQAATYSLPFGLPTYQELSYDLTVTDPADCWEPLTRRLLSYLARPFNIRVVGNRLYKFLSTIARELSNCTEHVTLINSADARGDGTFTVFTRFAPILNVDGVIREDEDGNLLESYTVESFGENTIVVSGVKAPGHGDRLRVSYTYLFGGLEYNVRQALLELNVLTATGSFLDSWGRWFGVARQLIGTYGTFKYGGGTYGTEGRESDSAYSRRIIDRVTQSRNTPQAIVDAVQRVTGGTVYLVEWIEGAPVGWIFKVATEDPWMGGITQSQQSKHLIWGVTSRFVDGTIPGGGACVFEVWIPADSMVSASQALNVANQYKAAGTLCIIRIQPSVALPPEAPDTLDVSSP